MPDTVVTRLTNKSQHVKHINLGSSEPGGETAIISVLPTGTGFGEGPCVVLALETDAERERFKRAISVKGVQRWIASGELVVVEAEPEPPPPPPAPVQVGVWRRPKPPSDE